MNQTNENDSVIKIGSPNFINEESYKIRNIIFQLGIRNINNAENGFEELLLP